MTRRSSTCSFPLRRFGRRAPQALALDSAAVESGALADDLRLFALTFASGFLFMMVYLA